MDVVREGVDLFFSERYCSYRNVVAVVGVLWLLWWLLKGLKGLAGDFCAFFLAPWGISRINIKKYGSWAVVTGASEGIWRGYALELARQGLNVVIMSRSQEKLKKVEDEIKQKYSREVCIIPVDFSDGMEIYPNLAEQLKDLDIGVFINNVGLGYEYPEFVSDCPADRLHKMIELNCQSMVQMTKLVLPKIFEKKGGVIVNISSSAGELGSPMLTVYNATKQKYSREVCIIPVDFSDGMEIYPNLAEQLKDLDIGTLVNNVGLSYACPGGVLHEQPADRMHKMIELNCQSMVQMTKLLLPKMLEKENGLIVNISSSSTKVIPPMLMCYGATKSFVNSFSEGLFKEYSSKGIIVQCAAPFFVSTSMTAFRRSNFWIADAIQFTCSAVATIGIKKFTYGNILHEIQGFICSLLPSFIMDHISWEFMKIGKARYLKRKAKAT